MLFVLSSRRVGPDWTGVAYLGHLWYRYLLLPSQTLTAESDLIETPLSMRGWRGALRNAFGHRLPAVRAGRHEPRDFSPSGIGGMAPIARRRLTEGSEVVSQSLAVVRVADHRVAGKSRK